MIQVFCARRGSGKTKRLIELANHQQLEAKGDSVYIDDDSRPMLQLNRSIRFIDTMEYGVRDCSDFYGMLCGIISSNYDIENMKEPHKRFNLKELYNKNIYIASTNQPLLDELQNFRISNSNENNTNDLRLKYKHICIRSTIFNRGSIMICCN